VPGAHCTQAAPSPSARHSVPIGQGFGEQTEAPVLDAEPASQGIHDEDPADEYVLLSQGVQYTDPMELNVPAGQTEQEEEPDDEV